MVSIYEIVNKEKSTSVEINEVTILEILKILKIRNKELYEIVKQKYEQLEKKIINNKHLQH